VHHFYKRKVKYGGMSVSKLKHQKELEEESRCLKQMCVDLSLEHKVLKDNIEKTPETAPSLCPFFYV
jgi:putative transposase